MFLQCLETTKNTSNTRKFKLSRRSRYLVILGSFTAYADQDFEVVLAQAAQCKTSHERPFAKRILSFLGIVQFQEEMLTLLSLPGPRLGHSLLRPLQQSKQMKR